MRGDDIAEKMLSALAQMLIDDRFLIEVGANERAMTSRLAAYVKSQFVGYDVDCEYNRMGNAQKRLLTLNNQRVYPDIIVHKRGTNEMNLLVIEAKKEGVSNRADILKLHAYKQDLHYQHACMVIFPSTPQHLHDEALSRYIQVY